MGGGQQLSSPGSCLESFRVNPYIECNSRGECHYFSNKYSYWLVTLAGVPTYNTKVNGSVLKAGQYLDRVSRCTVCILDSLVKEEEEKDHIMNDIPPIEASQK